MIIPGRLYSLLLVACLVCLTPCEVKGQEGNTARIRTIPEQNVEVLKGETPQWKTVWDAARKNAREGRYNEALQDYRELLNLKNNLEEGRWELAKLLMHLERWEEAAEPLEALVGSVQENKLYSRSLGRVMWEMKQFERAVALFGKLYVDSPNDQLLLNGLVEGLIRLGRNNEAVPYLEQLSKLEPTNRDIRTRLASIYFEEGKYQNARPHLTILSRSEEVARDILYKTARTYEYLDMTGQAAVYWERYLTRVPDSREAHEFLARYYEKRGQKGRSLSHLEKKLEKSSGDVSSFVRRGDDLVRSGESDKALLYYRKYLEKYPEDLEVKRKLVNIAAAAGDKKETLASIDQYFATGSAEKTAELKESIQRYEAAGRYQEAIPLYRQLIELSPDNPDILKALANDLLAIGENQGKISVVEYLSEIAPENILIHRSMAELLRGLEREDELLDILQKIHALDPDEETAVSELAVLYLQRGDLDLSREYFAKLKPGACGDVQCLQARASLAEKTRLPEHELDDYETLLKILPGLHEARLRVIYLAGNMGLIDTAVYHAGYMQNMPAPNESPLLKVLLADAYRHSGYFTRARRRYRAVIESLAGARDSESAGFRKKSWLGIAESYKESELYYEAEQTLRQALAVEEERIPFLEALFRLALDTGNIGLAEIWLQVAGHEIDKDGLDGLTQNNGLSWKKASMRAELYAATGDLGQAVRWGRKALSELNRNNVGEIETRRDFFRAPLPVFSINMLLVENLLLEGKKAEAGERIRFLEENFAETPELYVLLERAYRKAGVKNKAESVVARINSYADKDFGRQLALVRLLRNHGTRKMNLAISGQALARKPESMAAQRYHAEARIQAGEYRSTLELLGEIHKSYPDNSWLHSLHLKMLAKVGRFDEAVTAAEVILSESPERLDVVLLKARMLWEQNHWRDSVELYQSVLVPPVEDILEERMRQEALKVSPDMVGVSWWEIVTFSKDEPSDTTEVVMSPLHAAHLSDNSRILNSLAAPYYALYRWQQRFRKELAVRRAVMRMEYFHAANMLEDLIEEFGSDEFLLYDLAGLYSKLDRLGDEALVYRELKTGNAEFPGLEEAVQRNNLKRSPQMFLSYEIKEDDGWYGYKAINQKTFSGGGWFYQSINQRWSLDVARIDYEATGTDEVVWAWRSMLNYDVRMFDMLSLSLGGGVEDHGNGRSTIPLFHGEITGQVADELKIVLSAKQDVTSDTLASLTRSIKRRDYKAELVFNLFPRIVFGGYYDHMDYSDSNWTENSNFWASFILLPEPINLEMSYRYDFYDSKEGNIPGVPSADGFSLEDHPYWSPRNYWITRFSVFLKHQLSNDALARGIPSYYTIGYSLGYDSDDNDLHELKGSINIEIAKKIVVGASYGYLELDVFKHHETFFTLMYRW